MEWFPRGKSPKTSRARRTWVEQGTRGTPKEEKKRMMETQRGALQRGRMMQNEKYIKKNTLSSVCVVLGSFTPSQTRELVAGEGSGVPSTRTAPGARLGARSRHGKLLPASHPGAARARP